MYVYVLKSESLGKMYVGHAEDLASRLSQHNSGQSLATKLAKDWRVVYFEKFPNESLAIKRERYFKTGDGRTVLHLKGIV